MDKIQTNAQYQDYVNKKSPNSPIIKNCFNAFWVGGVICCIGQLILDFCKLRGFDQEASRYDYFDYLNRHQRIFNLIKSI